MFMFLDVLKIIASILITNSHYANIWPISTMASGGMLGNVMFFAVSGFGLYKLGNKMENFPQWYGKRIKRVYITVWIATILTILMTDKAFNLQEAFETFVYPTDYHFIASILVLYVVFYIFMCVIEAKKFSLKKINMLYVLAVLVIYIVSYDKTWNHIDVVEESFIRFLFFEAMLIGAQFKQNLLEDSTNLIENKDVNKKAMLCIVFVGLYFAFKILISRVAVLWNVQIISWGTILLALVFCFYFFASLETKLQNLPDKTKSLIYELSKRTLQIYLIQYIVIQKFEGLVFPINFIVVTIGILLLAEVVYRLEKYLVDVISKWRKFV